MNIRCHGCDRQFRVRQDRLPAQGARTRCPRCDEVLVIAPPGAEDDNLVTTAPAGGDDDLFQLPAAELVPAQDDLFSVGSPTAGPEPTAAVQQQDEDTGHAGALEDDQPRPGGLRGWLGRLFGRDS
jgi:predicted Zn finger-like uncharacterized protein